MAEWWNKATSLPIQDANFQQILSFYLFHCPCEIERKNKKGKTTYSKVSKRATTLRMQGWASGYLKTLLSTMKHTTSGYLEYNVLKAGESVKEAVETLERNSSLKDKHFEMIVMHERSDMNKTCASFYYVRNALAHGSFSVVSINNKNVYYLESARDGVVKARIRLREETMQNWISNFELSPAELKKRLASGGKKRKSTKRKGGAAA